jgi:hypothetical protein
VESGLDSRTRTSPQQINPQATNPEKANPKKARPEEETEKRPHAIKVWFSVGAFVVALLGFLLSIVNTKMSSTSLDISQSALDVSKDTLVYAQRAYLAIETGRVAISEYSIASGSLDDPRAAGRSHVVAEIDFQIVNMGQTPADVTRLALELELPPGWTLSSNPRLKGMTRDVDFGTTNRLVWMNLANVGPQSRMPWKTSIAFDVDRRALMRLRERPLSTSAAADLSRTSGLTSMSQTEDLRVFGSLRYVDVFKAEHPVKWCWDASPYVDHTYAVSCPNATHPD